MSKSRKPTISVVIPAYNAEKWISETIKSVQQQTFSNWEIIVIDDGSCDGTLETLRGIVDERLKVFPYEHTGVSVARNRGLAHSAGEFIAFLDADDLWTPDMLELHLAALQKHPEADVAYCWTALIDEKGKFLRAFPRVFFEGNVFPQMLVEIFLSCGSLLIRQQAIESAGEFDPRLTYYEDWDYWKRLARHSRFVLVPKYQLLYRQWPGSTTSKVPRYLSEEHEKSLLLLTEKVVQLAPQCFKNRCLAKYNLRVANLYIERYIHCPSDADSVKRAAQRTRKAILLEPKILLQITTLPFLGKWLLMRALPHRLSSYFLKLYRRIRYGIKSK
ncbi:MAG: glycosyltransferase family 2 protein [Xenococcaceae cyanobacterium]